MHLLVCVHFRVHAPLTSVSRAFSRSLYTVITRVCVYVFRVCVCMQIWVRARLVLHCPFSLHV